MQTVQYRPTEPLRRPSAAATSSLPAAVPRGPLPTRRATPGLTASPLRVHQLLAILLWGAAVFPATLMTLSTGRPATLSVLVPAPRDPRIDRLQLLLLAGVAVCALHSIAQSMRGKPARGRVGLLGVALAPWVAIQASAAFQGEALHFALSIYPLVAACFWLHPPPLRLLATIGWLSVGTATFSLLLGLLQPDVALVSQSTADPKAVLGNHLLAAGFEHPNALGIALALSCPAIIFIRSKIARRCGYVLVAVAVAWSASRTSMLCVVAAGICYALGLLIARRPQLARLVRPLVTVAGIVALLGTVVIVVGNSSDTAYSDRGYLWRVSLAHWSQHPWLGGGPAFYRNIASLSDNFGPLAFHGHNVFVQVLVTCGLLGVTCVSLLLAMLGRRALAACSAGDMYIPCYLLALAYLSWLEAPLDFQNASPNGWYVWVPVLVCLFAPPVCNLSKGGTVRVPNTSPRQVALAPSGAYPQCKEPRRRPVDSLVARGRGAEEELPTEGGMR